MKTSFAALAAIALTAVGSFAVADVAAARDQVKIAGSSTVLPYANIVAEQFGKTFTKLKSPLVESGGSGAGIKQFCAGVGETFLDIANSSRAIKPTELEECAKNGVKEVVEVKFGYDGIVFASDAKGATYAYTPKDWFLALAAEVPGADGKLVANPNKTWKQVNAELPDVAIAAYIPGEKHGTREVFEDQDCSHAGCDKPALTAARSVDRRRHGSPRPADKACIKVRKDGVGHRHRR